jgi:hypothetical protein
VGRALAEAGRPLLKEWNMSKKEGRERESKREGMEDMERIDYFKMVRKKESDKVRRRKGK